MKTALIGLALATMTFACTAESAGSAESLVEQCSGTYQCDSGSTLNFHKSADACMVNSMTFNPDGTVLVSGYASNQTWSGNTQAFQWCTANVCDTCTASSTAFTDAATADAGSDGGRCTGSSYGCGQQVPPYCSVVRGCHMATRIGPNNSFENYCTGYADSCSEMDTEADCKKQGCAWKP